MNRFSLLIFLFIFHSGIAQMPATEVDEMPYFPGCEKLKDGSVEKRNCSNRQLMDFVRTHLIYPDSAAENEIEGTVIVQFTIGRDGRAGAPRLLYDIGYGCGKEVLRIVQSMPRWTPALKNGHPVPVELELPVHFELKGRLRAPGYTLLWGDLDRNALTKRRLRQLLKSPVSALNDKGEKVELLQLKVAVLRNGKTLKEKISNGRLSKAQKKMLRWVRRGRDIELTGTIQRKGKFYYIDRKIHIR